MCCGSCWLVPPSWRVRPTAKVNPDIWDRLAIPLLIADRYRPRNRAAQLLGGVGSLMPLLMMGGASWQIAISGFRWCLNHSILDWKMATFWFRSPDPLRTEFVLHGSVLAFAKNMAKAKSEFIIAPMLLELRRTSAGSLTLFSGVEWDVDRQRGRNDDDLIFGRGPSQHVLQSPLFAIVEEKNNLIRTELGQFIAAMLAAAISHERAVISIGSIDGAVNTRMI